MGKPDQHEKRLEEYNDVFADIYNTLVFKSEVLDENKLMAGPTESINDSDTDDLLEQRRDVYKHYGELEPVSKLYLYWTRRPSRSYAKAGMNRPAGVKTAHSCGHTSS